VCPWHGQRFSLITGREVLNLQRNLVDLPGSAEQRVFIGLWIEMVIYFSSYGMIWSKSIRRCIHPFLFDAFLCKSGAFTVTPPPQLQLTEICQRISGFRLSSPGLQIHWTRADESKRHSSKLHWRRCYFDRCVLAGKDVTSPLRYLSPVRFVSDFFEKMTFEPLQMFSIRKSVFMI